MNFYENISLRDASFEVTIDDDEYVSSIRVLDNGLPVGPDISDFLERVRFTAQGRSVCEEFRDKAILAHDERRESERADDYWKAIIEEGVA